MWKSKKRMTILTRKKARELGFDLPTFPRTRKAGAEMDDDPGEEQEDEEDIAF